MEIVNKLSEELSKKEEGIMQKFILDIVTSLTNKVSLYENIQDCLTESGKINFPKDKNLQEQISWIEQEIIHPELDSINIKNDRLFGAYGIRCFGEKEDGERGYDIFENFNAGVVNNDNCRGIGFAESLDSLLGGQGIDTPIVAELRFSKGLRCQTLNGEKLVEKLYKHLSGIEEYVEKWM